MAGQFYCTDAFQLMDSARESFNRARASAGPKEAPIVAAQEGVGNLLLALIAEVNEMRLEAYRRDEKRGS